MINVAFGWSVLPEGAHALCHDDVLATPVAVVTAKEPVSYRTEVVSSPLLLGVIDMALKGLH